MSFSPMSFSPMSFSLYDLVNDVMRGAPKTIRVFLEHKMGCVGCPIATFHTVEDACREHGIDCSAFLRELQACG